MEFQSVGWEEDEQVLPFEEDVDHGLDHRESPISAYIICAVAAFSFIVGALTYFAAHTVEKGHFGVYTRNGKVLDVVSEPGLNFMLPFVTTYDQIQSSRRVHQVKNITCSTVGGINLYFEKVEITVRLLKEGVPELVRSFGLQYEEVYIHDNVRNEIEHFCSERTLHQVYVEDLQKIHDWITWGMKSGINYFLSIDPAAVEIIAVVVQKPKLPEAVAQAYARWEVEDAEIRLNDMILKSKDKEAIELVEAELRAKRAAADAKAMEILYRSKATQAKVLAESYYYEQKLRAEADLKVAEMAYSEEQLRVYKEGLEVQRKKDLAVARFQRWALESLRVVSAIFLGAAILLGLIWLSETNYLSLKRAQLKASYG
ncbi:erlin [Marchantia polymorpha subsp. ruderalis]|nr:hypothetical protein MARPO_0004s0019 [Marchantia polymorpha]BBN05859.1 hypothetical protein Mp_3g16520 [Marchantia polymorpha subsp. ruderalis]|eukprot:PTQ48718.1 hypothetical protein MARPO_0004s0019 [Marchantia polymorpha]